MKAKLLFLLACMTSCSSASETQNEQDGPLASNGAPVRDGGPDEPPKDSSTEPCVDCEYFPDDCSSDTLCPNGPFDPEGAGAGLDRRTWINVIRGRSADDVWAAGSVGALAHFDGTSWTAFDFGSRETIRALWLRDTSEIAIGPITSPTKSFNHVYARGIEGGMEPSAGGWAVHRLSYVNGLPLTPELTSGWGAPGSEWFWCAESRDPLLSRESLWRIRQSSSSEFEGDVGIAHNVCDVVGCGYAASLHGSTADAFWAVGVDGSTVRITQATGDRPSVKAFDSQTRNTLSGVWEMSTSDAWSVGARGTVRHYTGDPMLWDVVADIPTNVDLNAVWGTSSTDVWAVGNFGVVLHYDGTSWSRVKIAGLGSDRPNFITVWAAAPGHVWVGGQGVILSLGGKA